MGKLGIVLIYAVFVFSCQVSGGTISESESRQFALSVNDIDAAIASPPSLSVPSQQAVCLLPQCCLPESCPGPACPPTGSLPVSRTVTLGPCDPIPTSLINEIQDNIIGHKRPSFRRSFLPQFKVITGGSFVAAPNPTHPLQYLYQVSTARSLASGQFDVQFEEGDTFTGLTIEAYGDGHSNFGLELDVATSRTSSSFMQGGGPAAAPPPGWITIALTPPVSRLMAATDTITGILTVSGSPTGNFYIGQIVASFQRL